MKSLKDLLYWEIPHFGEGESGLLAACVQHNNVSILLTGSLFTTNICHNNRLRFQVELIRGLDFVEEECHIKNRFSLCSPKELAKILGNT